MNKAVILLVFCSAYFLQTEWKELLGMGTICSFDNLGKKIGSKENSILEFYQQFACVGGDPVFSESLCKELQKKFF